MILFSAHQTSNKYFKVPLNAGESAVKQTPVPERTVGMEIATTLLESNLAVGVKCRKNGHALQAGDSTCNSNRLIYKEVHRDVIYNSFFK